MLRLVGGFLVIVGCALVGRLKKIYDKRCIHTIEEFVKAVNYLICEMEFHRSPLDELCTFVADRTIGDIQRYFKIIGTNIAEQAVTNIKSSSDLAVQKLCDIHPAIKQLLDLLGESLGIFGVNGQIEQLKYVKNMAEITLERMQSRYEKIGRSNQVLWVCGGVALALVLI